MSRGPWKSRLRSLAAGGYASTPSFFSSASSCASSETFALALRMLRTIAHAPATAATPATTSTPVRAYCQVAIAGTTSAVEEMPFMARLRETA